MDFYKLVNSLALGALLSCISTGLYAAPAPAKCCCHHAPRLYFDLGVGKTYDYASSNSTLTSPLNTLIGTLNTNTSYSTPFFFIGLGYQGTQNSYWFPYYNVGVQHRYTAPINVAGISNITPTNTLNYGYMLQQESWLLMTKADLFKWKRFMPYLTAGAGVSFNRISQFFDNAPTVINQLNAQKNVTNDFSYSFGAGIDFIVKEDFWLSVGYFFDDFGKNSLDRVYSNATGNVTSIGQLNNASLHANSFYLKARYLFA